MHLGHSGTWALSALRHSSTWALRALRQLGTRALKALGHLGTRGNTFSRLGKNILQEENLMGFLLLFDKHFPNYLQTASKYTVIMVSVC